MESPISLRIPDDVLSWLDEQGKRGTVINRILRGAFENGQSAWPGSEEQKRFEAISTPVGKPIHIKLPQRWVAAHDSASCRVYKCGMCAAKK